MKFLIFTFVFIQAIQASGQSNIETAKGMLVSYNNRIAFFKTGSGNIKKLVCDEPQLGIEINSTAKVEQLLSYSKKIKVILAEYKNNVDVFKDEDLSYVPVKISYQRINTIYRVDSCEMAFIYKKERNVSFRFLCNNTGYSIESIELIK